MYHGLVALPPRLPLEHVDCSVHRSCTLGEYRARNRGGRESRYLAMGLASSPLSYPIAAPPIAPGRLGFPELPGLGFELGFSHRGATSAGVCGQLRPQRGCLY
jgi:hypothetical protein